jgi:DNA-binding transcriptional regulator YiaG
VTQLHAGLRGKLENAPYHYTQCGLDDVYLWSGFKIYDTPGQEGVAIDDIEGLHKAIGECLSLHAPKLNAKEFKFLRKTMDLTQAELAEQFGCDEQTIARWEKGETAINGAADRLIRLLYLEKNNKRNITVRKLAKKMESQSSSHKCSFEHRGKWHPSNEPIAARC